MYAYMQLPGYPLVSIEFGAVVDGEGQDILHVGSQQLYDLRCHAIGRFLVRDADTDLPQPPRYLGKDKSSVTISLITSLSMSSIVSLFLILRYHLSRAFLSAVLQP